MGSSLYFRSKYYLFFFGNRSADILPRAASGHRAADAVPAFFLFLIDIEAGSCKANRKDEYYYDICNQCVH